MAVIPDGCDMFGDEQVSLNEVPRAIAEAQIWCYLRRVNLHLDVSIS